jgi:proline iminopeptidase
MILFGVTTGRHKEIDWLFRGGVAIFFPEQWERLRYALPEAERDGDIVEAYYRRLNDADLAVRQRAAEAWCLWESATLDWPPLTRLAQRFTNPTYALAFARIVTHYQHHNAFLEDGSLLRDADTLAGIPGILVNGRFDFQAPLANAWELKRVWPRAELLIVDNAGHAPTNQGVTQELIRATDRFAVFR